MVQSTLMYTSEQINIPETLPNILKTYAKAAIRTQPYDLLRWSAAYFRCLANEVSPPVKHRLEKGCVQGQLTKGYLKVLLDQVGKGYFISQDVLRKRWSALCLSEEDLLKFLSLCRMLNWPQIHWLKLFAVLVGSLNDNIHCTLNMICELLTDNIEGGPCLVPMWMMRVCYKFIAELDCTEEQEFVDGRKRLPSGELEEEQNLDKIPQVLSTTEIRRAIFESCKQRYRTECATLSERSHSSDNQFREEGLCSMDFEFLGEKNPKKAIEKYGDFDSLILLLREAQGAKLPDYRGTYAVDHKHLDHASQRNESVLLAREKQAELYWDNSKKYLYQDTLTLFKQLGPPWSWLHQFTLEGCMEKSYNFVEQISIASDATPPESSDESFDFERGKPICELSEFEEQSPLEEKEESIIVADAKHVKSDTTLCKPDKGSFMDLLESWLIEAESIGEVLARKMSSVVTFILANEVQILDRSEAPKDDISFNIKKVVDILEAADRNGYEFEDITSLTGYLNDLLEKEKYFEREDSETYQPKMIREPTRPTIGTRNKYEDSSMESTSVDIMIDAARKKGGSENQSSRNQGKRNEEMGNDLQMIAQNVQNTEKVYDTSKDKTYQLQQRVVKPEERERAGEKIPIKVPMTDIIEKNEEIQFPRESTEMKDVGFVVLGLAKEETEETLAAEHRVEEEAYQDSSLSGTEDDEHSEKGFKCDDSSIFASSTKKSIGKLSKEEEPTKEPQRAFCCLVPPYPGIGPTVSKRTIQDFLTFLKRKSRDQGGLVMPRNFTEANCPKMVDCCNPFHGSAPSNKINF